MAKNSQLPLLLGCLNSSRILLVFACLGLVGTLFSGLAGAVSQGYQTKQDDLQVGMVVRLAEDSSPDRLNVEATDSNSKKPPLGIVSGIEDDLLAVGSAQNNVFVTNSGETRAYVSELGGPVKKGDLLTISPLRGVLQKAAGGSTIGMGTALEDFPTGQAEQATIKGANGEDIRTSTALLSVNIDIKAIGQTAGDESWLQSVGKAITGKDINEVRVVAAFVIFITLLVIEGVVVHGTITSTISAAGRNPMARGFIEQQSFKGVLIAMIVLLTSVATISLILWV